MSALPQKYARCDGLDPGDCAVRFICENEARAGQNKRWFYRINFRGPTCKLPPSSSFCLLRAERAEPADP